MSGFTENSKRKIIIHISLYNNRICFSLPWLGIIYLDTIAVKCSQNDVQNKTMKLRGSIKTTNLKKVI